MELGEGESCIAQGWRRREPGDAPCLGKGEAKSRVFVLTTTILFCRRADALQPRPLPSLEPLPVALRTHLSIFWHAQQDGEEQGQAQHGDLHLPLQFGECWVKLQKVRGRFIPPRTPPFLPP